MPPVGSGRRRRSRAALGLAAVGLAAVGLVLAIDATIWDRPVPRLLFGVLDESGHVATAALLLSAWATTSTRGLSRTFVVTALSSAILIDLDHIPNELFGTTILMRDTYRPYGHTMLTVAVAAACALVLRGARGNRMARAVAVGVLLHLLRDMATGGVPLLWPLERWTVAYPYPIYVALLTAAAMTLAAGGPRAVNPAMPKVGIGRVTRGTISHVR